MKLRLRPPPRRPFSFLSPLAVALAASPAPAADGPVHFNRDVRPILAGHCFPCHGPDAQAQKAKLRLDTPEGPDGAYRVRGGRGAIVPGDPGASEAWRRINEDDPEEIMPPPEEESHVAPLTAAEKETLRRWILGGARYEAFWSFVPPRATAPPEVDDPGWSEQAIDRFTLARMEAEGLRPSPDADRRSLIRRLSLDLTGLPPSREEISAFLADGEGGALERLVDRLMAKPQYGEHRARYWLDLVRFADTNGVHHDHFRDLTPYRDWVVRAFNDNLPYDDFVRYQIAGDLFPDPATDQLVASGFNRLHLIIDVGTALPEESHFKNVVDRVTAVGTAFMGLTLGCAVCHDHKYDPITQKDFYQLYAFFNNLDAAPETGGRGGPDFKRGLQPPYITLPTPEQAEKRAALDAAIEQLKAELETLDTAPADPTPRADPNPPVDAPPGTDAPRPTPPPHATAPPPPAEALRAEIKKVQQERAELVATFRGAMVMKERGEIRPAHIHVRGAYDNPGEQVGRDTPAFLPPLPPKAGAGPRTRLDLAGWLVDPSNPLAARVAVNRVWQQFFGVGLVRTSEDLGAQGEWPSHPGLLDHLAVRFVESGWDRKALVRSIVLSRTYRQSSAAPPGRFLADPANRLLARGSRFRLDPEVIRDQVLFIGGLLNTEMYGPSVKVPQPEGLWKIVAMPSSYPRSFVPDGGDRIYRRSLYTFWKRGLPPPQMTIFDAPTREACIARRERTNTPLQALVLMNETEYFAAAREAARHLLASPAAAGGGDGEDGRIARIYETVTSHRPGETTVGRLRRALDGFRATFVADPAAAEALAGAETPGAPRAELAAWTLLVHSLLNLDRTKTRE